jgi:tetratricopeptide (TPR) repeat protein
MLSEKEDLLFQEGYAKYMQGDFASTIELLNKLTRLAQFPQAGQLLAESHLELGNIEKAQNSYLRNGLKTQSNFCLVLEGQFKKARKLYQECPWSPANKWGIFLCDFLGAEQNTNTISGPGFLTFRLFLESTIFYFLQLGRKNYVDEFLNNASNIEQLFPELRKYIASAHTAYGWYLREVLPQMPAKMSFGFKHSTVEPRSLFENAVNILNSALKDYPYDAEINFKLGQVYLLMNEKSLAVTNFRKTLELLPGHIASQLYLEQIYEQAPPAFKPVQDVPS